MVSSVTPEETMLTTDEKEALRRWYSHEKVLAEVRDLVSKKYWEELEEHLQMRCLFPLSRHSELPEFMKDESGKPLFPTNLNPGKDLTKWQDAIEVAWEVVEEEFGFTHDQVHRWIAGEQAEDWERFLASVEERRKRRQE
jgi:hypothetical protein